MLVRKVVAVGFTHWLVSRVVERERERETERENSFWEIVEQDGVFVLCFVAAAAAVVYLQSAGKINKSKPEIEERERGAIEEEEMGG
jgi:hypothetical protein